MSTAFDRRVKRLREHVLSNEKGAGKTENIKPPGRAEEEEKDLLLELPAELESWKTDLEGMTVDELKELAGVLEVEIPSGARKAEIVAFLIKSKLEDGENSEGEDGEDSETE